MHRFPRVSRLLAVACIAQVGVAFVRPEASSLVGILVLACCAVAADELESTRKPRRPWPPAPPPPPLPTRK